MTKEERVIYKNAALNSNGNISSLNVDNYFTPKPNYNLVIEKPISKLAHFKGMESYLLSYPDEDEKISTKNYKEAVYYVKKQARYQDETYFLLSTKRSAVEGIIGWIQTKHLTIHDHVFVDTDKKEFLLTGHGEVYSDPWGGEKQLVIDDLSNYQDQIIEVVCTEYIGRNLWYQVKIDNELVWINKKFVK